MLFFSGLKTLMGDAFGQLSAICAVLGGFAVTFLGIIMTLTDSRKRVEGVAVIATACAACFFLGALGWALFAALAARVASTTGPAQAELAQQLQTAGVLRRPLSLLFLLGVALLFITLGAGGWLRSRRLGFITSGIAAVAAVAAWFIVRPFIL